MEDEKAKLEVLHDRSKELDDACATGRPRGERKVSKRKKRQDQMKIAAELGAGAALREVAETTGLSKTMVAHVKKKIEAGKDPVLVNVWRKAQEDIADKAVDAMTPAIEAAKAKALDPDTRGSDIAQIIRALGERVDRAAAAPQMQPEQGGSPEQKVGVLAGAIAAELLIKLQEHTEASGPVEVAGERLG